jgi:four helix bundle protein
MFDFEKLTVYQKATELNILLFKYLYKEKTIDPILRDQLKRATLSVVLNLAEGTGRVSRADKKRFYTIARSSVFECAAILEVLVSCGYLDEHEFEMYYLGYEEVSKMLLSLYRKTK